MVINKRVIRQFLLILTIVFIPYSTLYLFGNPYLFLPMISFIGFLLLSINNMKGLINTKGLEDLIFPWIVIWVLILIAIIYNFLPDYISLYRSQLQRRIIYLVFFLITINEFRRNPSFLAKVDNVIIFSLFIMVFFFITGVGETISLDGRLSFFGAGKNSIGVWSVIAITIAIDKLFLQKKLNWKYKVYYTSLIIVGFFIIIATGSRKALIMLFIGVFVYFLLSKVSLLYKLKLVIPFILISFLAYNYIAQYSSIYSRFEKEAERQNIGGRLPIWKEKIKIILDNPIIGAGPGLIRQEMKNSYYGRSRAAHNEFITIGALTGIPGVLIFIWFLVLLAKRSLRFLKTNKGSSLPFIFLINVVIYLSTAGGALNSFTTWFLFAYIAGKSLVFKPVREVVSIQN